MLLLISLRGNIFLYQGEELGLPQADIRFEDLRDPEALVNWPLTLGRDGARTPMPWRGGSENGGFSTTKPWLPVSSEHLPLAVDVQLNDGQSTLALTRRLLALRRGAPALRLGTIGFIETPGGLLAFEREYGGQRLLCIFNLQSSSQAWRPQPPQEWQVLVSVAHAALGQLPAWSGLILQHPSGSQRP